MSLPSTSSTHRQGGCTPRRPRIPSRRCWNAPCWSTRPASSRGVRDVIAGTPPRRSLVHNRSLKSAAPAKSTPTPAKPQLSVPGAGTPYASDDEPVTMPFGDLTVSEGTVIKWLKAVGDADQGGRIDRRDRNRQGRGRDRGACRRDAWLQSISRLGPWCRWAAASAASGNSHLFRMQFEGQP